MMAKYDRALPAVCNCLVMEMTWKLCWRCAFPIINVHQCSVSKLAVRLCFLMDYCCADIDVVALEREEVRGVRFTFETRSNDSTQFSVEFPNCNLYQSSNIERFYPIVFILRHPRTYLIQILLFSKERGIWKIWNQISVQ